MPPPDATYTDTGPQEDIIIIVAAAVMPLVLRLIAAVTWALVVRLGFRHGQLDDDYEEDTVVHSAVPTVPARDNNRYTEEDGEEGGVPEDLPQLAGSNGNVERAQIHLPMTANIWYCFGTINTP